MVVRLKDVAEHAGVSIKTVSNVVRGEAHVSEATRERVLRSISELGYRPHASARHLRTGRSGILALAVPDLAAPYFAELAAAVIAAAKGMSYTVLIEETGGDPEEELRIACGLGSSLIDGVLLSPLRLDQEALASRPRRVPLVLLGERDYELPVDHVLIDNVAAAREVTAHLLSLGHTRVAAIGAQRGAASATAQQRVRGYQEALYRAGVPYDPALTCEVSAYRLADGVRAMRSLLDLPEPPEAVFCFNDLLAAGAVRAAADRGLGVPRDVAIAGFDDVELSQFSVPSLTTVAPDKAELARLAVTALLRRIAEDSAEVPPAVLYAGHRLVVRESSGAATS
ncbi:MULTISPECIES: LacI family DNA-binding transcriptional regulator [unclassified Streptomyces]|uniref:LacI family DNA-binding transcriptional regulator n=1 Tax=unclassified Streptomyces TaxID=2593676 RepID=UPI0033B606CD